VEDYAFLLGSRPIGLVLKEFRDNLGDLSAELHGLCIKGLKRYERPVPDSPLSQRLTVQGGVGTASEMKMLQEAYRAEAVGWATPFLLVPDVVNVDPFSVKRLEEAGEEDVSLSGASPMGVPFWNLLTSRSEDNRKEAIASGKPGSSCPKGFLALNSELTDYPICAASVPFQKMKIDALGESSNTPTALTPITDKACLCRDLAATAELAAGGETEDVTPLICTGPNIVYFSRRARLDELVDHIYGRLNLLKNSDRPHVFIRELDLYLCFLTGTLSQASKNYLENAMDGGQELMTGLMEGAQHYATYTSTFLRESRAEFLEQLKVLKVRIEEALPVSTPDPALV